MKRGEILVMMKIRMCGKINLNANLRRRGEGMTRSLMNMDMDEVGKMGMEIKLLRLLPFLCASGRIVGEGRVEKSSALQELAFLSSCSTSPDTG